MQLFHAASGYAVLIQPGLHNSLFLGFWSLMTLQNLQVYRHDACSFIPYTPVTPLITDRITLMVPRDLSILRFMKSHMNPPEKFLILDRLPFHTNMRFMLCRFVIKRKKCIIVVSNFRYESRTRLNTPERLVLSCQGA
jgi:hypothetical protein